MKIQKIIALSIALVIVFTKPQIVFGQEISNDSEPEYLEYHYQVNFDDLDVFVLNGGTLDIVSNDDQRMDIGTTKAIDALMDSLSECSDVEAEIVAMLNKNQQLAAISFTEAPLLLEDGHYERVKLADATHYKESDKSAQGMFTMYTSVYRRLAADNNGLSEYTTVTYGAWSKNSALGGSKYPDAGDDYIMQSTPNTWTRIAHSMLARYDNSPELGSEGTEYHYVEGTANYLQCAIQDDPKDFAKARQNTSFSMAITSVGEISSSIRMIHSYYVHTWEKMDISVSLSVSSSKEVVLSVSPTKVEKSWQLYNDLNFSF